jgi:hypothetical protein
MRTVLATRAFARPGGSETYLLTVAEALERLGHQATIHCHEEGQAAELARSRGTRVETSLDAVEGCDAALAQDAPASYELAERFPDVFARPGSGAAAARRRLRGGRRDERADGRLPERLRRRPGDRPASAADRSAAVSSPRHHP